MHARLPVQEIFALPVQTLRTATARQSCKVTFQCSMKALCTCSVSAGVKTSVFTIHSSEHTDQRSHRAGLQMKQRKLQSNVRLKG